MSRYVLMSDAASVANRVTCEVEKDIVDRNEAITACAAVLELLRPQLGAVTSTPTRTSGTSYPRGRGRGALAP